MSFSYQTTLIPPTQASLIPEAPTEQEMVGETDGCGFGVGMVC